MSEAHITRFTIRDDNHGEVPCVELHPGTAQRLPLCLFLYGGGGSAETLAQLATVFEHAWARAALPPCRVVTPDVGPFSFYLDDPARGLAWESFVGDRLLEALRPEAKVGLVGVSMGGYGALKIAFARASVFRAAAAVVPMIEPACAPEHVPLRNRWHYPPGVPPALLGPERDPALYAADHPIARARRHAGEIRAHELAIYIDAASRDALCAHDGAEALHRALWDLDLVHEYRLRRDADHVGPALLPQLETAFAWVLERLCPAVSSWTPLEQAWRAWLEHGGPAPSEPLPPTSAVFPRVLRAQLEPARREAARRDPTLARIYGVLPVRIP